MKYVCSLYLFLLLSAPLTILAQSSKQNFVYLKNGSIIKGAILEMIPDSTVKIQTADNNILVFRMSEVERVNKEIVQNTKPIQISKGSEVPKESSKLMFSIFGGVALPMGDFASTTSSGAGFAKTGFALGAQVFTRGQIGFLLDVNYLSNSLDDNLKSMLIYYRTSLSVKITHASVSIGNYSNILLLSGLKIGTEDPIGFNFFFAPVIGLDIANYPEITIDVSGSAAESYPYTNYTPFSAHTNISSRTSSAVVYGALAEVIISNRFTISARYIAGEPKYGVTIYRTSTSSMSGSLSESGQVEQSISVLMFYAGIAF